MKKKVLLTGPVNSVSGYGVHSRLILRSLRKYSDLIDLYIIAVGWGATGWKWEDDEERRFVDTTIQKTIQFQQSNGQFDVSVICSIPNEIVQKAPRNILASALIETDECSPQFVDKIQLVDKVITVSQFAKDVLVNSKFEAQDNATGQVISDFSTPENKIEVISYPVEKFEKVDLKLDISSSFNFLCVGQWGTRKRIELTIKEFVETFRNDPDVGLILKLSSRNNSIMDRFTTEARLKNLLLQLGEKKCPILLLHGAMTDEEMNGLCLNEKVKGFISLSHGESFGLPVFSSAYNGLPVVSHSWGGQLDYLTMPVKNKKTGEVKEKKMFLDVDFELKEIQQEAIWDGVLMAGSRWAFPKPGAVKLALQTFKKEYPRFKQQAIKLQKYLLEAPQFSEEIIYKQYVEAILGEEIKEVKIEDLPLCSVITSVFRSSEYLEGCIKNIVNQTVFKSNIEYILVHPTNSPDFEKEKEIIDKYLKLYPENIKYLVQENENGLYSSWNYAIKNSTGSIINTANSDDRKSLDNVEKCLKEFVLNPEVGIVYMDQYITNIPNETFENNSSNGKKYTFPVLPPEKQYETQKLYNYANHAMSLHRKELHDKYGYFNEDYKSCGDADFALRCLQKGVIAKKMEEVLGLYLFNSVGISTNVENNKWKREEEKKMYEFYKDLPLEKE